MSVSQAQSHIGSDAVKAATERKERRTRTEAATTATATAMEVRFSAIESFIVFQTSFLVLVLPFEMMSMG